MVGYLRVGFTDIDDIKKCFWFSVDIPFAYFSSNLRLCSFISFFIKTIFLKGK